MAITENLKLFLEELSGITLDDVLQVSDSLRVRVYLESMSAHEGKIRREYSHDDLLQATNILVNRKLSQSAREMMVTELLLVLVLIDRSPLVSFLFEAESGDRKQFEQALHAKALALVDDHPVFPHNYWVKQFPGTALVA